MTYHAPAIAITAKVKRIEAWCMAVSASWPSRLRRLLRDQPCQNLLNLSLISPVQLSASLLKAGSGMQNSRALTGRGCCSLMIR
jgi:hypothetical protein